MKTPHLPSLSLLALSLSLAACGTDAPITREACEEQGGNLVVDPGDGSVHRNGCPWGSTQLGTIDPFLGAEGAICCRPGR